MEISSLATVHSVPDLTLGDLRAIVAQLRAAHPQAGPRLDHAAFIACFREVERGTSAGIWWVQSESDPNQTYMVTAGQICCCQDFARRGELTPCKHLLAVEIVQRAERQEIDRADAPIAWALTDAALAALGEPCVIAPQRPAGTITRLPMSDRTRALSAELYGNDPVA